MNSDCHPSGTGIEIISDQSPLTALIQFSLTVQRKREGRYYYSFG
jgi:hypothetical protein